MPHPSQSSSPMPSSIETIGYRPTSSSQYPTSSDAVSERPSCSSTYDPSRYSSDVAGSTAIATWSPGEYPAARIPSISRSSASALEPRSGANPPSSPTVVDIPRPCRISLSRWNTSEPHRRPSPNDEAPTGTIMNSWKSTLLSAWAPPLSTFIIGTGSRWAVSPPR